MTRRTVAFAKLLIAALALGAPLLLYQSFANHRELLLRDRALRASVSQERFGVARQIAGNFLSDAKRRGGCRLSRGGAGQPLEGLPPFMDREAFGALAAGEAADGPVDARWLALLWRQDAFASGMPARYAGLAECLRAWRGPMAEGDFERLYAVAAELWRGVDLDDEAFGFLIQKLPAPLAARFAEQRRFLALAPPLGDDGFYAVIEENGARCMLALSEQARRQLNQLLEAFDLGLAFAPADQWLDWGDIQLGLAPEQASPSRPVRRSALLHAGGGLVIELILLIIFGALANYERVNRAQKQLLAAASHELRTPLAVIRQFAEMLIDRRDRVPEKLRVYHEHIHQESLKMQRQVENLLSAAKFENLALRMDPAPFEVGAWLEEILASVAPLRQNAASLDCDNGLAVCWDRGLMSQAVVNLLENARVHAKTAVAVAVTVEGEMIVIQVRDYGPGADLGELSRVRAFKPGRGSKSGLGLGLYLADRIVRAHGGSLAFERADPGLRAVLRLPQTAPER